VTQPVAGVLMPFFGALVCVETVLKILQLPKCEAV
jgi:hypothetical protein